MTSIVQDTKTHFEKSFDLVTITGTRYRVTTAEVFGWFTNYRFYLFLLVALLTLIFLMPHNRVYGLEGMDRLYFWTVCTTIYISIYVMMIDFGASYASQSASRYYYSPIGMVVATVTTTILGSLVISDLHQAPVNFGWFRWLEMIFNLLWASAYEAFHFAFIVPRLRQKRHKMSRQWEEF